MIVRCSIDDGHGGQFEVEVSDDGYRIGGIKVAPEVAALLDAEILGPFADSNMAMICILIDIIRHAQGYECESDVVDCQRFGAEVRKQWDLPLLKTR